MLQKQKNAKALKPAYQASTSTYNPSISHTSMNYIVTDSISKSKDDDKTQCSCGRKEKKLIGNTLCRIGYQNLQNQYKELHNKTELLPDITSGDDIDKKY